MAEDMRERAKRLVDSVEYDVNGLHGKGGHGGLTSDKTLRAAAELRVIIDRNEKAAAPVDETDQREQRMVHAILGSCGIRSASEANAWSVGVYFIDLERAQIFHDIISEYVLMARKVAAAAATSTPSTSGKEQP